MWPSTAVHLKMYKRADVLHISKDKKTPMDVFLPACCLYEGKKVAGVKPHLLISCSSVLKERYIFSEYGSLNKYPILSMGHN